MSTPTPESSPAPTERRPVAAGHRSVRLGQLPTISVVVASRGSLDRLAAVVATLCTQRDATERQIELIVVRAALSDPIDDRDGRYADVRFVTLPGGATLSQLRSAGVAAAEGDVIVLADDEQIPPADWLARVGHGTRRAPAPGGRHRRPSPAGPRSPALPVSP